MTEQPQDQYEWQQYYPTYRFQARDILLKEYEAASNNVLSQERVFTNAANLLLVVATLVGSAFVAYVQYKPNLSDILSLRSLSVAAILLVSLSWLTVRYFADRQKSIIFDSRKIVVLRRMLGLDYGTQQLVLPNWRIEGASNPFAIRLFPGWLTYAAYPFWIILLASSAALLYLLPALVPRINDFFLKDVDLHLFYIELSQNAATTIIVLLWMLFLAISFRRALYDSNENLLLLAIFFMARILRVHLVDSFEYIIYRARLGHYELVRLRAETNSLKLFLVHIEDRTFYENKGISIRGIARAAKDYLTRKRISGGSTLTQQLVRSLFIVDYHKTLRRKLLEIPLAFWATSQFSKQEILDMYIASVKFERGVYGLAAALHFFFPSEPFQPISKVKAFFLAERVSNTRSRILADRLRVLIKSAEAGNLLNSKDIKELKRVYESQVSNERLRPSDHSSFQNWLNNSSVRIPPLGSA